MNEDLKCLEHEDLTSSIHEDRMRSMTDREENPLEPWITAKAGADWQAYQIRQIRRTLVYAYEKSPFYRELYRDTDIERITSLADFAKLPLISAEDLTNRGMEMLCVPRHQIERIVTLQTSGTSGEPKQVYFTAEDQELTVDFFHHGMQCLVDRQDRVMILLPWRTPGSVGDLLRAGLTRLGCGVYPYGLIEDYDDAAAFMLENQITSLVANPVQALKLAEIARMRGFDIKLDSILLSTDYVAHSLSARLETIWGCKVFEHYGMTETGFGGGVFCRHLRGYHLREADLYFEIVSESGKAVTDGVYGEIVFTTLTRTGMPLIRYRTGDYGRFLKERCACGERLKLMEKIKRRMDGSIQGRYFDRIFYISDFDELLFSYEGLLDYELEYKDKTLWFTLILLQNAEGDKTQHVNIDRPAAKKAHVADSPADCLHKPCGTEQALDSKSLCRRLCGQVYYLTGLRTHVCFRWEEGAPQKTLQKRRIQMEP